MSGVDVPTPEIPFAYTKFLSSLQGAGIRPVRNGQKTHLMALTDKHIDELAGDRELKNAETVNWKDMAPVPGGLFSEDLTGGHATSAGGGNKWSYIKLAHPLPSPVMEDPIRATLGLTKPKFEAILSGKEELNGMSGPEAISKALQNVNLDSAILSARATIASGKRSTRDSAIKRLGYLTTAKKQGIHPKDWILTKVPVLPPAFRPVSTMGNSGRPLVDDSNLLYKELFDTNKAVKDLSSKLDPSDYPEDIMQLYNSFKAVTGLGDPVGAKNKEKQVKGILKTVFGPSGPKTGTIQRKLLGATTDFVARGVISPDPELTMDQVGIPEEKAWDVYKPQIVRRLVRRGASRMEAMRAFEEKMPMARKALTDEMEDGVVMWNRAPTLHRYGIMAARPVLVKGKTIQLSPLA